VFDRGATAGYLIDGDHIDRLVAEGWIADNCGVLSLTVTGSERYVAMLSKLKAIEADALSGSGDAQIMQARALLETMIEKIEGRVSALLI
jgi:DNA-binding MarR family transcriptional regulator